MQEESVALQRFHPQDKKRLQDLKKSTSEVEEQGG